MNTTEVEKIMAPLRKQLLIDGGVDNWTWYSESLESYGYNPQGDPVSDAVSWLEALDAGGVDNWVWYGASLGASGEYEEYLDGLGSADHAQDYETWEKDHAAREQAVRTAEVEEREAQARRQAEAATETARRDPARVELVSYLSDFRKDDGEDLDIDAVVTLVWKRTTFPKQFDTVVEGVKAGKTLAEARTAYVRDLIDSGTLSTWLDKTYEADS